VTERRPPPTLNIANALTVLRLLMVPLFVVALMVEDGQSVGWRVTAFVIFAGASFTDQLDGYLARRLGLVTDFGAVADPIADKALTGAALIGLSVLGELPWWVTLLIGAREVGVTVLRFLVMRHGVIPASRGGKLKTLVQGVALGLFVLPLPALVGESALVDGLRWTTLGAALVLTVVTGLDYVARALRLRARAVGGVVPEPPLPGRPAVPEGPLPDAPQAGVHRGRTP
jgi:CDP-diacylglycerol---glycerol-3-phosphate 3-phosphatidyltransferase